MEREREKVRDIVLGYYTRVTYYRSIVKIERERERERKEIEERERKEIEERERKEKGKR